ncbi:hypothetical protein C8R44DRAFT_868144 [Mycena epipterygia]|nr:hypothetical protein C8R44DRAFT_868144 [Mycena epipterygia]
MTFSPPPVCAQAAPDSTWAFPTSAPSNATPREQIFLPNYTNTAHFAVQSTPVVSHSATYPYPAFPQYSARAHAQHTPPPFSGAFTGHQPTTLLPSSASTKFMAQGCTAPYPFLYQNIYPPRSWKHTAPFMPQIPANLPLYPTVLAPSIKPQPRSSQQCGPQATGSGTQQTAPPPVAAARPVVAPRKRKRAAAEPEQAPNAAPQKKRARVIRFAESHPHIEAQTTKFKVEVQDSSPKLPMYPPPPVESISQPMYPGQAAGYQHPYTMQTTTTKPVVPASSRICLYQVPPEGIPDVRREGAVYIPPPGARPVWGGMGFICMDHLLFGKDNKPLPSPLPAGCKLFVRIFSGDALEEARKAEGTSFFGNELYAPRTGERHVLRIMDLPSAADFLRRAHELGASARRAVAMPAVPPTQTVPAVPAPLHESVPAWTAPVASSPGQELQIMPVDELDLPDMHVDSQTLTESSTSVALTSEVRDQTVQPPIPSPEGSNRPMFEDFAEDFKDNDPFSFQFPSEELLPSWEFNN